MAIPRTRGRRPSHRLRPALPKRFVGVITIANLADGATTVWTDQTDLTGGHLELGYSIFNRDKFDRGARSAIFAPRPGTSSTQCSFVEGGIKCRGKLFPIRKSLVVAVLAAMIVAPTSSPLGATM